MALSENLKVPMGALEYSLFMLAASISSAKACASKIALVSCAAANIATRDAGRKVL